MDMAPVMLDGRTLFEVGKSGDYTAVERAQFINMVLQQEAQFDKPIQVEIIQKEKWPSIRVNDRPVMIVTEGDIRPGFELQDIAQIWQQQIEEALDLARVERSQDYTRQAMVRSSIALASAIVLSCILLWISRRLSTRRKRRPDRHRSWQQFLPLGLICLELTLWIGVGFYITDYFPLTRQLRYKIFQTFAAPIFPLGERDYSIIQILELLALTVALWFAVRWATQLFKKRILVLTGADPGIQDIATTSLQYVLCLLGLIIILQVWGIDVSSLAILVSVLGVGIGFGLQNIANNFISGLIIAFERPIKIGDLIKLGDLIGTVERIGPRSTEVATLDRVSIIVPNSRFIDSEVINWSYGNPVSRLRIPIGVAYDSNVQQVRKALLQAVKNHRDILNYPAPQVWFQEFGDSSLNFDIFVWIREPHKQFKLRSDLNYRIEAILRRNGIEIPFPQRDLHLRSPQIEGAIASWLGRGSFPEERLEPETPNRERSTRTDNMGQGIDRSISHSISNNIGQTIGQTIGQSIGQSIGQTTELTPIEYSEEAEEIDIDALIAQMRGPEGVEIKDRRYGLNVYPKCFLGSEAVQWLMWTQKAGIGAAIEIGKLLIDRGVIHHVTDEHDFKNERLFYRFYIDEQ